MSIVDWFAQNWQAVVIPVIVFLAALIALFWLRTRIYTWLKSGLFRLGFEDDRLLSQAVRIPSILWAIFIAIYLGFVVSTVPDSWKQPVSRGLWTLFAISLAVSVVTILGSLVILYGRRLRAPRHSIIVARSAMRIVIYIVALLAILEIWGIPTSPVLLLIAILALAAALALRDSIPNFFAGLQIAAGQHVKLGDYIKLESGEEGIVTEIGWTNTRIRALDQGSVLIPNSRLVRSTVVNYGQAAKKARQPFQFNSRTDLKELTGIRARNLEELLAFLKVAPDSVIYYHTHSFLQEHHYLTPEPSNDFALWVTDALGYEVLGERLASVDTFEFPDLRALRDRLSGIIQEYLGTGGNSREAMEGREFHFIKSVSVVFPTAYTATDLREFVEALRKISLNSLYYHIFESRLRLGRGQNDFSIWLRDSLGESELADEIARLDPYTYTLEGLKSRLVQLIERHTS